MYVCNCELCSIWVKTMYVRCGRSGVARWEVRLVAGNAMLMSISTNKAGTLTI